MDLFCGDIESKARLLFQELDLMPLEDKVQCINAIRRALHEKSPFSQEPVDCVTWVKSDAVYANDYNPNSVAPPEMELLRHSIESDGYTQPIVSMRDSGAEIYEVIDGFHRHRVGKECADIQARIHGYLPIVQINTDRRDKSDRMAATIRHNRARGKHRVDAMADIVMELKRRRWNDEKIGKELGMDPDEVLRLGQVTGLAELFSTREFSEAWEADVETDLASLQELGGLQSGDVEDSCEGGGTEVS